ncbi:MAG: ABC transporter permease [Lachnospiraceae bacterium]|nr:ABC transporter permease [Lachnospiraceae bacterium]
MISIIKSTLKLLFRNIVFWIFLITMPVLSTIMLRIQADNIGSYDSAESEEIIEISDPDNRVGYYGGKGKYVVKVYDASGSELSEYMLNLLVQSGMITPVRAQTPEMTAVEAEEHADFDGYNDFVGADLYLDKDFDEYVLNGEIDKALTIYVLSDDERIEILENEIRMFMGQVSNALRMGSKDDVVKNLDILHEALPEKETVIIGAADGRKLTNAQLDQKALVGYAFAFLTLGFVFGGVLIAYSVIRERKDMVLTRIKLTRLTDSSYFAAKFICGGIVSFIYAVVTSLITLSVDTDKLGMSRMGFFIMIFGLGLIFCSLSLMLGILFDDVMSATVSAFILWTLSSLLSGLYFSLDAAGDAIKTMSYLMPSKWFLDATEMLMLGDNKVYFMILCVTTAYLIVTLGLGSIGIKIRNHE